MCEEMLREVSAMPRDIAIGISAGGLHGVHVQYS